MGQRQSAVTFQLFTRIICTLSVPILDWLAATVASGTAED